MFMKKERISEKPNLNEWLAALKAQGFTKKNAKLWRDAYSFASRPRRKMITVNLARLSKIANPGESIVVPGKVLGSGRVSLKFNIAAIEYSLSALEKLRSSGCTIESISQAIEKENVRLVV
jgi:large subunit ribosomal protein L18e